jgi:hypothetical protein
MIRRIVALAIIPGTLLVPKLASAITATATLTRTAVTPSPTPTCIPVNPASLVFTHIDVDPRQPVAGDTVYIDFGVCLEDGPGGVFFYRLDGAPPLLEGDTERAGNSQFGPVCDEGRFEMRAVAGGTASLTIQASYETAVGCVGALAYVFLYERSGPISIEIGIGTPQPTATRTVTATATPSRTPSPSITSAPTRTATAPLPPACHSDCDGDLSVTVDEIVFLVFAALGNSSAAACPHADIDEDTKITVDEILRFVAAALHGCGSSGLQCDGYAGGICPAGELCDKRNPLCAIIFDHAGRCVAVPEVCPAVFFPVCGCDSRTYSNECERMRAGVQWHHDGACR